MRPRMTPPFDVVVRNARVVFTADGPEGEVPADAVGPGTDSVDARGGLVAPGFVDSHTHLVWAGDRANEFALRCAGADYLSIAKAGGGIASTVRSVREATDDTLLSPALPRLQGLLAQ